MGILPYAISSMRENSQMSHFRFSRGAGPREVGYASCAISGRSTNRAWRRTTSENPQAPHEPSPEPRPTVQELHSSKISVHVSAERKHTHLAMSRLEPKAKRATSRYSSTVPGASASEHHRISTSNKLPLIRYSAFSSSHQSEKPSKHGVRRSRRFLRIKHSSYSWTRSEGDTAGWCASRTKTSYATRTVQDVSIRYQSYGSPLALRQWRAGTASRGQSVGRNRGCMAAKAVTSVGGMWSNGQTRRPSGNGPFVRPRSRHLKLIRRGNRPLLRIRRRRQIVTQQHSTETGVENQSLLTRYQKTRKGNSLVRSQTTLVSHQNSSNDAAPPLSAREAECFWGPTMAGTGLSRAKRVLQQAMVRTRNKTLGRRKKKDEFCLFFNKFGRCKEGENCPYFHDTAKVAVCRRFLKGECLDRGLGQNGGKCLLSHQVDTDKMPICSFFLRGCCVREDCPYSHVKVNDNAQVCPDFRKGYCPRGKTCGMKHTDEERASGKRIGEVMDKDRSPTKKRAREHLICMTVGPEEIVRLAEFWDGSSQEIERGLRVNSEVDGCTGSSRCHADSGSAYDLGLSVLSCPFTANYRQACQSVFKTHGTSVVSRQKYIQAQAAPTIQAFPTRPCAGSGKRRRTTSGMSVPGGPAMVPTLRPSPAADASPPLLSMFVEAAGKHYSDPPQREHGSVGAIHGERARQDEDEDDDILPRVLRCRHR